MSEKRTTVRRDKHEKHRAWKMREMFAAMQNWMTTERKGTKQRKVRWGRAGAKRRSRTKATRRSIAKKRMTRSLMQRRRRMGQNARTGKR